MSETNEIRKAIMERLGSVAKFSTTHEDLIAELRRLTEGKHTGEWHTIANTWLSRKRATGNREIATEANRAYDFVEREMLARMKQRASRPGAKAKFGNGDKNRRLMQVLADADRRIANQVVSNIAAHYGIATQQVFDEIFDAEAEDLMDYLTEPVRSAAFVILKKKGMMSRPGAKAKMQKEYVLWGIPKGKTSALDEQVLSTQAKTPAQMDAIKKRAAADGWHSFRVQVLDLSKPYTGFSRPGAKMENASDRFDAKITSTQLIRSDGRTYEIKSRMPASGAAREHNGQVEWLDILGKNGASYIVQVFENGMYRVLTFRGKSTGWQGRVLSSRPGAKAKMDRWEATQTKKHGKPIIEHTATINGVSYMIEKPYAMGTTATLYMWNDNRGMEPIATGDVASLKSRAEGMRKKEARGVAAIERRANYARPGAKAKMGKDLRQLNTYLSDLIRQRDMLVEDDRRARGKDMKAANHLNRIRQEINAVLSEIARMEKTTAAYNAKSTHAADEAVSKKIALLMDEGYPQDQAVAIALDMKRKGNI